MSRHSRTGQSQKMISVWNGLLLFAAYLLTFSGRFHVMDELAVFAAGDSFSCHWRMDINQLIWTNHWTPDPPGIWGQDGNLYTKKVPSVSLLVSPLLQLARMWPGANAVYFGLPVGALITAATASLLAL
jgi:hypothetical protein